MKNDSEPEAYLIHVWIRRTHPMLWRRFLVSSNCTLASLANHHHRRASGANDGGGASTRSRMDYRGNSNGDSSVGSSPRNKPDKDRNKLVRPIFQNNRQPSLFEAR